MHIHWFSPERYYQATEDTQCLPNTSDEDFLKSKQIFYCESHKEWQGRKYAVLEEIIDGYNTDTKHLYCLNDRPFDRIPFVALNPAMQETDTKQNLKR